MNKLILLTSLVVSASISAQSRTDANGRSSASSIYRPISTGHIGAFTAEYAQELLDMVISSGSTQVSAVQFSKKALTTKKTLETWNEKTLVAIATRYDKSVRFTRFRSAASVYRKKDVERLAHMITYEVNDYSTESGMYPEIRRNIFRMMADLAGYKLTVVSRVQAYDIDNQSKFFITVTTFINRKTGTALSFYTRQGWI